MLTNVVHLGLGAAHHGVHSQFGADRLRPKLAEFGRFGRDSDHALPDFVRIVPVFFRDVPNKAAPRSAWQHSGRRWLNFAQIGPGLRQHGQTGQGTSDILRAGGSIFFGDIHKLSEMFS